MDCPPDESATLREVMGSYPTGVTIVAACEESGAPYGLTVNSFTSVSLDPPLVLVCIGHSSSSHERLVASPTFSINLLSATQEAIAVRFATEPSAGRFDEVEWEAGESGCPLLPGAVASLECSMHEVLLGGDHSIIVGRVRRSRLLDRPALVFHRGRMSTTPS